MDALRLVYSMTGYNLQIIFWSSWAKPKFQISLSIGLTGAFVLNGWKGCFLIRLVLSSFYTVNHLTCSLPVWWADYIHQYKAAQVIDILERVVIHGSPNEPFTWQWAGNSEIAVWIFLVQALQNAQGSVSLFQREYIYIYSLLFVATHTLVLGNYCGFNETVSRSWNKDSKCTIN